MYLTIKKESFHFSKDVLFYIKFGVILYIKFGVVLYIKLGVILSCYWGYYAVNILYV